MLTRASEMNEALLGILVCFETCRMESVYEAFADDAVDCGY